MDITISYFHILCLAHQWDVTHPEPLLLEDVIAAVRASSLSLFLKTIFLFYLLERKAMFSLAYSAPYMSVGNLIFLHPVKMVVASEPSFFWCSVET